MTDGAKVIALYIVGICVLAAHYFGYQDALTDCKMKADADRIKEPKKISGERMIRSGYPGLPAHLRCPAANGRGHALKQWHAHQADGGDWSVSCEYEDAK